VWVGVLGPLRLVVDGQPVDVPGPKRRAVLALLALAEGRTVPVDHLVDALWPSGVPESGRPALHTHVSRLRGHLGAAAARLQTRSGGYRLELDPGGLDLSRARTLLATARTTGPRDPAGALALLLEAHALWRGPILADLADLGPVAAAAQECARLHQQITDALVSCAIEARQADTALGLAAAAHAADPLREPAVVLLMRTLAATGRGPEALRVGREFRRRLADETGLDPSPALAEVERAVAGGAAGPALPRPAAPARPTTRLFGREGEVAAVHRLLATERLITIAGPGGVGKTRVALEVAGRTGDATVLLLAPVTDPAAVPHALAAALDLSVVQGDVLAACLAVLGDRSGLLVVDNCEHLLAAVRDTVGLILASCPRLSVLTTSREPLGLPAEYAFRLAPLRLPGDGRAGEGSLAQVPSVAVFLDRASRVRPGSAPTAEQLPTVADIVRRLDGMPLAIELAAGRLSTFSLDELRARLDRALDLLGDGRPTADMRHRTLRATVDWSYTLLSADQQRLFRHMSVFVDGIDLDTAERLAAELDGGGEPGRNLARLVDASMVEADFAGGGTRYRMLETLRAYGRDRLEADGEAEAAESRLLRWAVGLAAAFEAEVTTDREPEADALLRRELANLRAAWRLARRRGALDESIALVVSLYDAIAHRDLVEIRVWAEELAGDPGLVAHPRAAAVLGTAAEAAYHRGDYRRAEQLARAGIARAGGDRGSGEEAWHWIALAVAELARGAYADVVEHCLALAPHTSRRGEVYGIAALAALYSGDIDEARALHDRGRSGLVFPSGESWRAYVTAEIESAAGNHELAERHYLRAIELARRSGATFLVGVEAVGLQAVRAAAGRVPEALRGYRDVVDYFARTGNWIHLWTALRNLAQLLRRLGDAEAAAALDAAADRAPDAPALGPTGPDDVLLESPAAPVLDRIGVLAVARAAIEHHLGAVRVGR
jgi:predicted ATPase/DNA-binding SARP family transcriptional activator